MTRNTNRRVVVNANVSIFVDKQASSKLKKDLSEMLLKCGSNMEGNMCVSHMSISENDLAPEPQLQIPDFLYRKQLGIETPYNTGRVDVLSKTEVNQEPAPEKPPEGENESV